MATNEEKVLEEDPRLKVAEEEKAAVAEVENAYNGMIDSSDEKYQAMIDATKANEATQTELQNKLTDQAVTEINQQKDQAQKDYLKEQSGAYVDWQKQSNQYGVNAEAMASQGMTNTGYSESSKVAMYTAYQNRVATARESYNKAVLNYDNAIANARLQNSVAIAELAAKSLETQLQLALQGFQYKNSLIESKMAAKTTVQNNFYSRYQDVLDRMQREEEFKYQKDQDAIAQQNWKDQFQYQKDQDIIAQENWQKEFDAENKSGNPFGGDGVGTIPAGGNENTKVAENTIMDEKGFNQYKTTVRTRVNGKNYTNYQDYVLARIEDMANNGLNGRKFTDEEIEWLLAKYGDL